MPDLKTGLLNTEEMFAALALARTDGELVSLDVVDAGQAFLRGAMTLGDPRYGDHELRRVAAWLRRVTTAEDTVSRWAGDRFLLILRSRAFEDWAPELEGAPRALRCVHSSMNHAAPLLKLEEEYHRREASGAGHG